MVCVAAPRAREAFSERLGEEPHSYKFDRRRGRRHAAPATMPATFSDGDGRFGVTSVEIIDAGPAGLGLRSLSPVDPGMTVALHTPGSRFPAVTATVVRCEEQDGGYLVGLTTRPPTHRAA